MMGKLKKKIDEVRTKNKAAKERMHKQLRKKKRINKNKIDFDDADIYDNYSDDYDGFVDDIFDSGTLD